MSSAYETKADLVIAIQTLDALSFKLILEKSTVPLPSIIDHNGASIFHELASTILPESTEFEFLEIFITFFYIRYHEKASEMIKCQLNKPTTNENLTPAMLAVKGNKLVSVTQSLLKEFARYGADLTIFNNQKQSPMHIACLNGFLQIAVYLKYDLNLPIDEKDSEGKLPIHLAIKNNRENLSFLLIAWGIGIDVLDNNKKSVLHYAAESNNYRLCRMLIIRGASRKIRDAEGNTPFLLAKKKKFADILKILVKFTQKKPGFLTNINPCKPAVNPREGSYCLFTTYILIFILRYILVIVFMLPHFAIELSAVSVALFITSLVLFIVVNQKDPGFMKKTPANSLKNLYEKYHSDYVCPFCEIKRAPRARHCQYCDRCVRDFDHHCPWIRNCVGKNNHSLFLFFIFVCSIDFLYTSTLGVLDYLQLLQENRKYLEVKSYHKELGLCVTGICALGFFISFPVCVLQMYHKCKQAYKAEIISFRKEDGESLQSLGLLNGQAGFKDSEAITDSYETPSGCCGKSKNVSVFSEKDKF